MKVSPSIRTLLLAATGLTVGATTAMAQVAPSGTDQLRRLDTGSSQASASLGAAASTGSAGAIVVDQDLRSLLRDFGKRVGIRVKVEPGVRGRVRNARLPGDPEAFLAALGEAHDIDWFFDGDVLNVYPSSAAATRIIGLGNVRYDRLKAQLQESGLWTDRFPIRQMQEANAISLSGPPGYLARVEVIVESLKSGGGRSGGAVRVIRHGKVQFVDQN
ncbi:MAG: hypothetical protein AAF638_08025 [Pseudomonadota bacterium]